MVAYLSLDSDSNLDIDEEKFYHIGVAKWT